MPNAVYPQKLLEIFINAINNKVRNGISGFSVEGVTDTYNKTISNFFINEESKNTVAFAIFSSLYAQLQGNNLKEISPNAEALLKEMVGTSFRTSQSPEYQLSDYENYQKLEKLYMTCKDEISFIPDVFNNFINEVGSFDIRVYAFASTITAQVKQNLKPEPEQEKLDIFLRNFLRSCVGYIIEFCSDSDLPKVKEGINADGTMTRALNCFLNESRIIYPTSKIPDYHGNPFSINLVLKKGDREAARANRTTHVNYYFGSNSTYNQKDPVPSSVGEAGRQV